MEGMKAVFFLEALGENVVPCLFHHHILISSPVIQTSLVFNIGEPLQLHLGSTLVDDPR